jgi:hypothetical protein
LLAGIPTDPRLLELVDDFPLSALSPLQARETRSRSSTGPGARGRPQPSSHAGRVRRRKFAGTSSPRRPRPFSSWAPRRPPSCCRCAPRPRRWRQSTAQVGTRCRVCARSSVRCCRRGGAVPQRSDRDVHVIDGLSCSRRGGSAGCSGVDVQRQGCQRAAAFLHGEESTVCLRGGVRVRIPVCTGPTCMSLSCVQRGGERLVDTRARVYAQLHACGRRAGRCGGRA